MGELEQNRELERYAKKVMSLHDIEMQARVQSGAIRIAYFMDMTERKRDKRKVWARIQKAPEVHTLLHGYNFIMTVWYDVWKEFTTIQREALIYHELCHIDIKEMKLVKHDYTLFHREYEAYGPWASDLMNLKKLTRQFDLDFARSQADEVIKILDHDAEAITGKAEITAEQANTILMDNGEVVNAETGEVIEGNVN